MDKVLRRLGTRFAFAAMMAMGVVPLAGQAYRAPPAPDGKPDLNGIWQALNEANYDLEGHMARPAMALRPGLTVPLLPAKACPRFAWIGIRPPTVTGATLSLVGLPAPLDAARPTVAGRLQMLVRWHSRA